VTNFLKILELKGIRKLDQNPFLELFNTIMSSQSDLVDQSPLLTPLSVLPRGEGHNQSSSVSRFDATNLSNALSSVTERLPRTQTASMDGVTSAKLNEGLKSFTRNLRRDFTLRGFGQRDNKDSRESSGSRDSPVEKSP
jgi:vacuolar protein sorting-associated protein 53